jgi:tRNA 2-thiouridine synthesizing protein E
MGYMIGGEERETDDEGFLLEPDLSDEAVHVIAAAEGIELTEAHWAIVRYMREQYAVEGKTPNFRTLLKDVAESIQPGADSKYLYNLFPAGPARQAAKVAGLPKPFGKGGY